MSSPGGAGARFARRGRRAVAPEPPILGLVREVAEGHTPHDPGESAEHGEGHPPPERRDEGAGARRDHEDPEPHAARDDAHGESAPRGEPPRGGRRERDVERARAESPEDAERDVELPSRADLAGDEEGGAEQAGAGPDDAPGPDPVGEDSRHEGANPEDDPVDEGDPGDQGPGPAELFLEGPEEHGQREDGAGADGDDGDRRCEDDPAVEDAGAGRDSSRCGHESGLYAPGARGAQRHACPVGSRTPRRRTTATAMAPASAIQPGP